MLVDAQTGPRVEPAPADKRSGKAITKRDHVVAAGPVASDGVKRRVADRSVP